MSQLQVTGEAKIRDIQGPVVANSGVVTALDGAASQYVRGDGTLADFPTSTGGGSSVSYYLNSSVSQGTIGGVAYRQLGKTPISGAGTDIAISSNGYVASYITDANDPALLEVPAGNFNCEFYFSVNNNTGDPFVYAEVYKYDGTTFTLLGTSVGVPEYITEGTVINPYYFAVPVATSVLTVTDRIAIRIYVNVDGRTVTLHTENNHLCQVVTTFSKGLISLNNLTRQNQFFQTGTSGTDFGISSSVATHTFNLPVASATNTGKLSSTDWSTFNNKIAGSGTINTIPKFTASTTIGNSNLSDNGNTLEYQGTGFKGLEINSTNNATSLRLEAYSASTNADYGIKEIEIDGYYSSFNSYFGFNSSGAEWRMTGFADTAANTTNRATTTWQIPSLNGTYGYFDVTSYHSATPIIRAFASNNVVIGGSTNNSFKLEVVGTTKISGVLTLGSTISNGTNTYTLPDLSGTLALLEGSQTFSGGKTFSVSPISEGGYSFKILASGTPFENGYSVISSLAGSVSITQAISAGNLKAFTFDFSAWATNATRTYLLPDAEGTLALTSNLSSYVPYTGASANVNLGSRTLTTSNNIFASSFVGQLAVILGTSSFGGTVGLYPNATYTLTDGYLNMNASSSTKLNLAFGQGSGVYKYAIFDVTGLTNNTNRTYTLPDASGTLALTSNLSAYVPYTGATGAVDLGTNQLTSGNVGIGPTESIWNLASSNKLQIRNSLLVGFETSGTFLTMNLNFNSGWKYISNGFASLYSQDAGAHVLFTSASSTAGAAATLNERFRITNGGNVGIGTSSPSGAAGLALVLNSGASQGRICIKTSATGDASGAGLQIGMSGADAFIEQRENAALSFATNATERMRITSGGRVCINTTSQIAEGRFNIVDNCNVVTPIEIKDTATSADGQFLLRFVNNSNSVCGSIAHNSLSSVAYNTTSDYRLKEDLKEIKALEKVCNIKVYDYKWKDSESRMDGVLAHELADVIPYAVTGEKDGEMMQGVDYSKIVPVLVKAIQEQQAQIEELKALIAAK